MHFHCVWKSLKKVSFWSENSKLLWRGTAVHRAAQSDAVPRHHPFKTNYLKNEFRLGNSNEIFWDDFQTLWPFWRRISFSAFDLFPDRSFYRPDYCFHPRGPRGKNYFALHCFNVRLLPYHWCIIHRALQPMANPVENWKVWVSRSSLWKTLSQDSRIHNGSRYSNHSFGMIIGSTVFENRQKKSIARREAPRS